jgi:hypothetical protein
VFGALGAWVGEEYNAFAVADLPNWVSQIDVDDVTSAAFIMTAVFAAVILLGGWLGGRIGVSHNRKVDAAILEDAVHGAPTYQGGE